MISSWGTSSYVMYNSESGEAAFDGVLVGFFFGAFKARVGFYWAG